jgi:hypothetical protein
MSEIEVTDHLVFTVYSWFQSAMKCAGRKINFPQCSDLTKTYQFRWTKSFCNKCYNEFDLDDKTVHALVYEVVRYAKSRNVLDRGTQILSMGNMADICYKTIIDMMDEEHSLINEIQSCHEFLSEQVNGKDKLVRILGHFSTNGYPNIVNWYLLGHITDVYLALSKSCTRALSSISDDKKEGLPSSFESLRLCSHITLDKELLPKLRELLGPDLRIPLK